MTISFTKVNQIINVAIEKNKLEALPELRHAMAQVSNYVSQTFDDNFDTALAAADSNSDGLASYRELQTFIQEAGLAAAESLEKQGVVAGRLAAQGSETSGTIAALLVNEMGTDEVGRKLAHGSLDIEGLDKRMNLSPGERYQLHLQEIGMSTLKQTSPLSSVQRDPRISKMYPMPDMGRTDVTKQIWEVSGHLYYRENGLTDAGVQDVWYYAGPTPLF